MTPVFINRSKARVPRAFLTEWIRKTAGKLAPLHPSIKKKELVIVFVDSSEMKKLNFAYRKKNYATDVLSFAPGEPGSLGELVLCPSVLKRQAKETGLTYNHELGYMIIHGCLHLLGYDHETNARDAKKMFALQDKLFARLTRPRSG